jgi:hypothetical protein
MGGNDKAGVLTRTDWEWHRQNRRRSAQLLLKSGKLDRYYSFMTPPGPECTYGEPEKAAVWYARNITRTAAGKVTREARFAIRPGTVIILKLKYSCSILDIYDLGAIVGACQAAKRPAWVLSHER